MKSICLLIISLMLMVSCTKELQPLVLVKPAGCDSIEFSYSIDIKPLIDGRCSGPACHSPGTSNYDFSRYSGLADRVRAGRLEERLLLSAENPLHMPLGSSLSDCDLFMLRTWIHQGFKNN